MEHGFVCVVKSCFSWFYFRSWRLRSLMSKYHAWGLMSWGLRNSLKARTSTGWPRSKSWRYWAIQTSTETDILLIKMENDWVLTNDFCLFYMNGWIYSIYVNSSIFVHNSIGYSFWCHRFNYPQNLLMSFIQPKVMQVFMNCAFWYPCITLNHYKAVLTLKVFFKNYETDN